ncbi:MAG: type II toxin-antitoxin system PemK/MazF family toxin [Gammaproteobacteria bacterium]
MGAADAAKRRIRRGDVCWVNLDLPIGSEIKRTRPALVISPDDMNRAFASNHSGAVNEQRAVIRLTFKGRHARILLDQVRCVDKRRLTGSSAKLNYRRWHPILMQMLA